MVRVAVLGSDYFQNKRDVTRMRCTRKSLNCTAHAIDDQNNGRWVSANQPMIEHRPHAIQLYLDQWFSLTVVCADAVDGGRTRCILLGVKPGFQLLSPLATASVSVA